VRWLIKQQTLDQSRSSLMTKMPLEIRLSIYEFAIFGEESGKVFHMFRQWRKMNYWQCHKTFDGLPCCWGIPCSRALPLNRAPLEDYGPLQNYRGARIYNVRLVSEPRKFDGGVVSLMRTCRQM
jgi:hypothetical protein